MRRFLTNDCRILGNVYRELLRIIDKFLIKRDLDLRQQIISYVVNFVHEWNRC
jgi:hypothetical protein